MPAVPDNPRVPPAAPGAARITLNLIETARRNGHHRVVEKNEQVAANLERIITACQSCQPAQVVAGGKIVTPGVADAS